MCGCVWVCVGERDICGSVCWSLIARLVAYMYAFLPSLPVMNFWLSAPANPEMRLAMRHGMMPVTTRSD